MAFFLAVVGLFAFGLRQAAASESDGNAVNAQTTVTAESNVTTKSLVAQSTAITVPTGTAVSTRTDDRAEAIKQFLVEIGIPVTTFAGGAVFGWLGSFASFSRKRIEEVNRRVLTSRTHLSAVMAELENLKRSSDVSPDGKDLSDALRKFGDSSDGIVLPQKEGFIGAAKIVANESLTPLLRYTSADEAVKIGNSVEEILKVALVELGESKRKFTNLRLPHAAKKLQAPT